MKESAVSVPFASMSVGDRKAFTHTISEKDVAAFADISGDYNPLHMDEQYAKSSTFGRRVVHGMFLGALLSRFVGMLLPGAYALLMKEQLEFKKAVFIDDTVILEGEIVQKSESTRIIELKISISRGSDLVAVGSAHVRMLQ